MKKQKYVQRTQKALERGSQNQQRGAAGAYLSISKTPDSSEFCF